MGLNTTTYVLSKGYTKSTSNSLGAVKGAPATIKSITEIDGGHRVTFEWTGNSGKEQTEDLIIKDGIDGKTPLRGVDYWTDADIDEIKNNCKNYIDNEILGGAS